MSAPDASPIALDDDFVQRRHNFYQQLRQDSPVRRATLPNGLPVWLVTRHADAREALASPLLSKDSQRAAPLHDEQEERGVQVTRLAKILQSHMLNLDPPDHTRLRKLVTSAFTQRRVELLRTWVEEVADGLLDGFGDRVDLLADFAFPLTVTVIGELFGVPADERAGFREMSDGIAFGGTPEAMGAASARMADYLADLVARKRDSADDDLLTALIRARDLDDRLDEDELVASAFLMLTAGYESTAQFIGNAVLTLVGHPDQLALFKSDPAHLVGAVEELLRFEGPGTMTTLRFTTAPLTLGGVEIPANEFVVVLVGVVNRDPDVFPDPDRLDITRADNRHLAFGHGVHRCLGAPLARLEGQVALGKLFERYPDLALAAPPESLRWKDSILFHGLDALPVHPHPKEDQ
ncbi:cytochrome P450 family protein [Saccharothrix variisporea]|uniref:Cytochrome P450 n=1 Tax=Saccharothrix variisporea TaxID=543527 RepID=A0A495XEM5_9PSEU|nr:cytochrome P450 [Saccharothrix variisporea]RKT72710.1 cytochrome P450 [Saccharothrix variisporea]